jgi:hypothetical protein
MPTARIGLAAATAPCPGLLHGTCVYGIGGFNGTFLRTVEAYSPATNTWAKLPSMPTARDFLAAATAPCPPGADGLVGTCVYAIGGYNGTDLNTVEAYSPATNTWATLPSMPTARNALAGATAPCPGALDRACVYATGGHNSTGALNTVEAYTPATNTWATLPSMPTARYLLAGATAPCPATWDRACVYAIGGTSNGAGGLNTVEAYTPATNTWAELPAMPTARLDLAGATAPCPEAWNRACVYAVGGSSIGAGGGLNTAEAYTPATDTWAELPSMPTGRFDLAGATAPCPDAWNHACVYAIGGGTATGGAVGTVEAFRVER